MAEMCHCNTCAAGNLSGRIALDRKRNVVGCASELWWLQPRYIMVDTRFYSIPTDMCILMGSTTLLCSKCGAVHVDCSEHVRATAAIL
jgi:hypothetical protein